MNSVKQFQSNEQSNVQFGTYNEPINTDSLYQQ